MRIWINLLYHIARRAVANDALWSWVEARVHQADAQAIPGAEKRAWVTRQLDAIPEAQRTALGAIATWLLNLAVEAMVARIKVKK